MSTVEMNKKKSWMIGLLLFVAGLGGLLFGIDVGIIAGALPYLEATAELKPEQLSFIVAAVLIGGVISTLFAGLLADLMGRKMLMALSGILFVVSIPTIALSHGYVPLVAGRLLQGISGGLIGVVVPLYLAECLNAANRGKGTGLFQWMLTLGIVAAALIGQFFSNWLDGVEKLGDAALLLADKDFAWRSIFWVSLPPGVLFVLGSLMVPESPRWLFRRGRLESARKALLQTINDEEAELEMKEMANTARAESETSSGGVKHNESLLHRKYVIPFVLACIILACTQLTGIDSIIGYEPTTLLQAGLHDVAAHWGSVLLSTTNFLATIIGVVLVDRKGRKFLLTVGATGIIVSLGCTGLMFRNTESAHVDCKAAVQKLADKEGAVEFKFDAKQAAQLLAGSGQSNSIDIKQPTTLVVIYSYGDYVSGTSAVRSDEKIPKTVKFDRKDVLPGSAVDSFFKNPFANLEAAKTAPLVVQSAYITPVPSELNGWITAFFTCCFAASFAMGPGVCVWLALSELMPTRIRSNGMSIALLVNRVVSATIAAMFLPTVGKYGYSTLFFAFAGFTVIYLITAVFFLPETKGKTLEEIEEHFSGKKG